MLVLSRKKNEQLVIQVGDQTIVIRVLSVIRDRVRVGILANPSVAVHREEIAQRISESREDMESILADSLARM